MVLCYKCTRASNLILLRGIHTHPVLECSHYKTLGLSPSATSAEIKSAYYELSKKHHPDRNQGSEKSSEIFRNVSAAYEVLGNEKSRKQYDREQQFQTMRSSFQGQEYKPSYSEYDKMMYERRKSAAKRYYARTHYDFDAWYKAHYGNSYDFYKIKSESLRKKYYNVTENEQALKQRRRMKHFFILYSLFCLGLILLTPERSSKKNG